MPAPALVLRRTAAAVALGAGGLSALAAAGYGLLRVEAGLARRTIGDPLGRVAPVPPSRYGAGDGPPLRLVVLGDSSAAGLGALHPDQTPAAVLAGGLAALSGRPVELVTTAVVGAVSSDLAEQVDRALRVSPRPDVAMVMVGANDVTHRVRPADAARSLAAAVTALRAAGAEVVVGTCPDFGSLEPLAPPLRQVAQRLSRELAAAQTVAVVEVGGRTVSLGGLLGPVFHDHPSEMFAADGFHPSPAGYARVAAVLLPTLAAALGLWAGTSEDAAAPAAGPGPRDRLRQDDDAEDRGQDRAHDRAAEGARRSRRWEGLRDLPGRRAAHHGAVPLAEAAEAAAATPGTEVAPAGTPATDDPDEVSTGAGQHGGAPRTRWALGVLRRRTGPAAERGEVPTAVVETERTEREGAPPAGAETEPTERGGAVPG